MSNSYPQILSTLKESIRKARLKVSLTANREMLELYCEIGQTILQQQRLEGWGTKVIQQLAKDLLSEFPDMKGLSLRNLKYMRSFADAYPNFLIVQHAVAQLENQEKYADSQNVAIVQHAVAQLPWGHHCVLLDKLKTIEERLFYLNKTIQNNWSRDVLKLQIESNLYLRQGKSINNFESTLPLPQADLARETLKNPYVFDFLSLGEEIQERDIENALIAHLKKFMLELGRGFAYVGNQYNIKVEEDDYYLDLLFYNTRLHAYVIFELKIGDFKPEFAGKLNFYINAVDSQVKSSVDNPTIGVLLCKTPNKTEVQYALHGINTPLGIAEYKLLPEELKIELPSIEEFEKEFEKEIESIPNPLTQKINQLKDILAKVKSEKVVIKKTKHHVKELFLSVIIPIIEKSKLLLIEILPMFNENKIEYFIDNETIEFFTSIDLEARLIQEEIDNKNIHKLGFNFSLIGFNQGGTNIFSIWHNLFFELNDFKYVVKNDTDKIFTEKLYSEIWTTNEIEDLSDEIAEKMIDKIHSQLNQFENY